MNRNKSRTFAVLIALIIALVAVIAGAAAVKGSGRGNAGGQDSGTAETATAETGPSATVMFASDYQAEDGWPQPADTLREIVVQVRSAGKEPDNLIYCGDYTNDIKLHDYQISPEDSIQEIRGIASSELPGVDQNDMIFVQGNHDALTESITPTGLYEYDGYLVYVLNTQYDFPWKQGRDPGFESRVMNAADEMGNSLNELIQKGETRPVFIAGHVPLHFTARTSSRHSTGDNMYSSYIFKTVNEAAKSLDIVYMFGHNHSKGWDCYLGGASVFRKPGDTLLIPVSEGNTANTNAYNEETLEFTYMNAGYTGYYMNCGGEELADGTASQYSAADETLTASICEIKPDEIVITRYSGEGIHQLGASGEGDPYKGGIDEGLIGEEHYSTRVSSPAHIVRRQASQASEAS